MPRIMLDSDQPAVLLEARFADVLIATYADLVTPEIIAAAGPRLVVIDRGAGDPHDLATVADIEPGLLSVAAGAEKIRQWDAEKRPFPTAYHDRADWAAVNEQLTGVAYHHWVATLDGTLVPNGFYMAAVQFQGAAALGFHADISIVWDDSWHPAPAGPSPTQLAQLKQLATVVAQGGAQLLTEIRAL